VYREQTAGPGDVRQWALWDGGEAPVAVSASSTSGSSSGRAGCGQLAEVQAVCVRGHELQHDADEEALMRRNGLTAGAARRQS